MSEIFRVGASNIIFSATQYPRSNAEAEAMGLNGGRNKEMRAMTIAAFRVAQNNTQLSTRGMDRNLLLYVLADSTTALNHWISKGRLVSVGVNYALTPTGLAECQNTLLGSSGAYSTTEAKVHEWVVRLVHGDAIAVRSRSFPANAWSA